MIDLNSAMKGAKLDTVKGTIKYVGDKKTVPFTKRDGTKSEFHPQFIAIENVTGSAEDEQVTADSIGVNLAHHDEVSKDDKGKTIAIYGAMVDTYKDKKTNKTKRSLKASDINITGQNEPKRDINQTNKTDDVKSATTDVDNATLARIEKKLDKILEATLVLTMHEKNELARDEGELDKEVSTGAKQSKDNDQTSDNINIKTLAKMLRLKKALKLTNEEYNSVLQNFAQKESSLKISQVEDFKSALKEFAQQKNS